MAHKLQCSECGYQETQKSSLNTLKSKHLGQKFQCPQGEHQATQKSQLVTHQISVHMGKTFQCPECEHQLVTKVIQFVSNQEFAHKGHNLLK